NDEMTLVTSGVYRDVVGKTGADWMTVDRHLGLDRGF
ncbi:MAG: nuclear transport factor 2 family protein, partial [Gammaproteobacteria bacterium]|nr:nuclear transport factor 2 family protein [Gammaproteobacteria bacterium]